MKKILLLLLLLSASINSQNLKIYGTVKDASTGEPLSFANISVQNNLTGTTTGTDGKFEINLNPGDYELLASYIGYKTEILKVELRDKNIIVDISLTSTDILLQEVSVYSAPSNNNESVSSLSLQSKEIEEISSVFPDVFRSIQALPGIAVNNEFSAKFNVRGGNYDENLVLVNGTQVYEPFHIKEADNASVGIFNIDLMKKVNLINGGFSARYGDRLSSVLNIEYREGNKEKHTGSATLSLTNLDAFVEGPISENGSYILGFRKSYLEYVLSLLEVEETAKPSFYDVQGVVTYNLSDANKLQFKFIHAGDDFEENPGFENYSRKYSGSFNNELVDVNENRESFEENNADYFSNLFDIQNRTIISSRAFLTASLSYYEQIDNEYKFETNNSITEITSPTKNYFYKSYLTDLYKNKLTIKTWEGKASLDFKVNPFYDITSGFSYLNINYQQELIDDRIRNINQNIDEFPDTLNYTLDENNNVSPQIIKAESYKIAGYVENVFQINDDLIINLGGRIDYFEFNEDLTFSPRFSASYKTGNDVTIRAAWGHYYQSPIYRQLLYSFPSDTNTQSQKAEHFILGVEKSLSFGENDKNSLTLKAEGYYKKYSDLISSERNNSGRINYSRKNDSEGYAVGIDLYASLKLQNFYGWISYGLLFAKEDLLNDGKEEFPRYTDQRHTLSVVNDFNLGSNWNLNLRFTYGSGFAYTPFVSRFNSSLGRYEWIEGKKNSEHLPAYKRVDLRVSKEFTLWNLPATAFLDVNNLFNFKNIYAYRYRFTSNGLPQKEEIELWPIIPTLGITINF